MAIVSYKSLDTSLAGVIPIIDIGNYKRKPMRNLTVLFLVLSLFGSSSLGIIKLSSCSEEQANVKCIQTEREALLSFKEGLIDHSGRLSSWVGEDCCQWRGIECNKKSGHVTKLDLRNLFEFGCFDTRLTTTYTNSCMGGEISSSLTHLKYLNYLDLSLNYFGAIQIPEFFGMLENLMYLNLSSASFSGEIPPHLGNLSRLMYLDLHDYYDNRKFVGNLGWLSSLSSLKYLNMGGVNLNSAKAYWLQAVNMLPSLLELHLSYCELESLPSSIAFVNFTSLFVLDLSGNQFNSSIIQLLFNITSLTKLDLSFNSFQGIIPYDAVNLINLEDLDLSNNYIIGPLPSLLGNLCNLKTLDLSSSNIDRNIDELFGNFSNCLNNSLESLDMRDNTLVGKIPDSLGRLGSLRYLNLQFNSIWGSIPDSIGSLSSLQQLDLSDNEMNGTIPKSLGQLSKLVRLNLNWNSWEGVITKENLMNLTRLKKFTLRTEKKQSLIFNVTYDWIPPFKLRTLELQNCLIGLKFPIWLQVQSELINVILRNVGITDTFPKKWFSRISSQLIDFDLSNNQIMGKLPHPLVFPNADIIDLSYNCLQGPIPLWYTNGTRLSLKSNLFSGHIPSNIGDLMQGLACLDLPNNLLNGTIPLSIQKMTELRILILRRNKLSGELPHHWNESQSLWALVACLEV